MLEICVDTVEGLHIATNNGADRIELCASLGAGGLTPSVGMLRLASSIACPTRVMIRPRQGDFTYSEAEMTLMLHDIDMVADLGLEGVVVGANHLSGELDEARLLRLTTHAKAAGLMVTLHRSFDITPDLLDALQIAQGIGVDTILTSGGATTALAGVDILAQLVRAVQANPTSNPVEIMAGVGVNAKTVGEIIARSGVQSIHGSCSSIQDAPTGKAGAFGFSLPEQRRTDAQLVRQLRDALPRHTHRTSAPVTETLHSQG